MDGEALGGYDCSGGASPDSDGNKRDRNRHGAKDMNGNYPGPRNPISFHLIKADGSRIKVSTLGRIVYNQHYGDIMFILMFE